MPEDCDRVRPDKKTLGAQPCRPTRTPHPPHPFAPQVVHTIAIDCRMHNSAVFEVLLPLVVKLQKGGALSKTLKAKVGGRAVGWGVGWGGDDGVQPNGLRGAAACSGSCYPGGRQSVVPCSPPPDSPLLLTLHLHPPAGGGD